MTAQDSEAALVRSENGGLPGIVTDRILRTRLVAEAIPADQPIRRVLRESVITIPRHAQVYEALLLMQEKGVEHLAVTDDENTLIGLIHSRDILHLHSSEAALLTDKIAHAETAEEAIRWCRRAPLLAKSLLDSGAHTRQITRLISAVCDAATVRFIELAGQELGSAPGPFVFLALGSQGRQEMTLFADQDNALLYSLPESGLPNESASRYFNALGTRVCAWLEGAGYPFCRGAIMANNPKWCASLEDWKQITADWIGKAEPQQLLEFNIFLDFRAVFGDLEFARQLRLHVHQQLQNHPPFLPFLARDLMRFRPPPNRFIRWLYSPAKRDRVTRIDLKEAMLPLVGFSRLYALRHRLNETHTLDRIEALNRRNLTSDADLRETVVAYDSLLKLRLLHQAECLQENRPLDNTVDWPKLDPLQKSLLREAFARIAAIQNKISYDFLGGT
jgi:CBS domain-containing protein